MSDEELLIMYQKYKRKRMIIIAVILLFILLISLYLYFHFNNTSSPEVEKIKEEVIVKDEVAPIIKLKVNNIEITKGDDISYLDYIESVIDDKDGDLLDKVKYQEIDTSIIGEQSIIYSVSDNSGNSSQEILSVLIKEKILENNNGHLLITVRYQKKKSHQYQVIIVQVIQKQISQKIQFKMKNQSLKINLQLK